MTGMSDFDSDDSPQPLPGAAGVPPRTPKSTARGMMDNDDDPRPNESILDEIQRRVRSRYPSAQMVRDKDSIAYFPEHHGGFVVRLRVRGPRRYPFYTVSYAGASEKFDSSYSAVGQFGFGLSNGCRIREYTRAGRAYRWVVEIFDPTTSAWKADWDHVNYIAALLTFGRHPGTRCLQNHLIDLGGYLSCAA